MHKYMWGPAHECVCINMDENRHMCTTHISMSMCLGIHMCRTANVLYHVNISKHLNTEPKPQLTMFFFPISVKSESGHSAFLNVPLQCTVSLVLSYSVFSWQWTQVVMDAEMFLGYWPACEGQEHKVAAVFHPQMLRCLSASLRNCCLVFLPRSSTTELWLRHRSEYLPRGKDRAERMWDKVKTVPGRWPLLDFPSSPEASDCPMPRAFIWTRANVLNEDQISTHGDEIMPARMHRSGQTKRILKVQKTMSR